VVSQSIVYPTIALSTQELAETKPIVVIKHRQLLGPGLWNGRNYTYDSIKESFDLTDWNNPNVISLFYDHEDRSLRSWVGKISNPTLEQDGIWADLLIYDPDAAMKLDAGMPFGLSVKLDGIYKDDMMEHYTILNTSLVTEPACRMSYINNAQEVFDEMSELDVKVEPIAQELKKAESEKIDAPVEAVKPVEEPELKCDPKEAEKPKEEKKMEAEKIAEPTLGELKSLLLEMVQLMKANIPAPVKKEEPAKEEVVEKKPEPLPPADKADSYPYPEDEKKKVEDEAKKIAESMAQELAQIKAENEKLKKDLSTPAPQTASLSQTTESLMEQVRKLSDTELNVGFIEECRKNAINCR
jgi:hypothetical protein